jgi:ERCC4-type nuclease
MPVDLSQVMVSVTKPKGKVAKRLAALGIQVVPITEDEGNVDRYVLGKRLAVERRTGGGFLMGIMDKTLFTSAIYLRQHFRIPVLIVEGKVNYEYSAFDPQAVLGALSSMMLQYGINVLSTTDAAGTVDLIAMMARQEQLGIPEISLIPKRSAADLPDQQRRVIEMLPGCGMVMARDLLQRFGSVKRIVNATEAEFLEQRGIGARKAKAIVKVLDTEYGAVDTERNLEDAIAAEPKLLFRRRVTLLDRQHHIFTEAANTESINVDAVSADAPVGSGAGRCQAPTSPTSPTSRSDKHIVDMVFVDKKTKELILVELKRGRLERAHVRQLRRYLDHARESKLLCEYLDKGFRLHGLLATVEPCEIKTGCSNIAVQIIDRKRTIAVLKKLRRKGGTI